jgi:hypothetical protein
MELSENFPHASTIILAALCVSFDRSNLLLQFLERSKGATSVDPFLFSYKDGGFLQSLKAQIQLENSSKSKDISFEAVQQVPINGTLFLLGWLKKLSGLELIQPNNFAKQISLTPSIGRAEDQKQNQEQEIRLLYWSRSRDGTRKGLWKFLKLKVHY